MKRTILFALAATLITTTVAAQAVMRPRPGAGAINKATPQAPVRTQIQALSPQALTARLRPAPQYIPPQELPNYGAIILGVANAPFSLTPLAPEIVGRGKLEISGDISAPNPPPPGFGGQAILRYRMVGFASAVSYLGTAVLKINAVKNKYYAVDCLAVVDAGRVNFRIFGGENNMEGQTDPKNGHLFFNVRRTADDGPIYIDFHPDYVVQEAKNPLQPTFMTEKNVMDFWGCQITPSG
jgi:hypothetical protein